MVAMMEPRTHVETQVSSNIEKMYTSFPSLRAKRNGWHEHRASPKFDCREREDGTIEIHSWTGRTGTQILAMGNPPLTWSDIGGKGKGSKGRYERRDKLDLMDLAHHHKLEWQYLFSLGYSDGYSYTNQKLGITQVCVKIGGYFQPDGTEHSKHQLRLSTTGTRRFLWNENTPGEVIPCGLHKLDMAREQGYLVIGEGSSDTAVMWWHGFPFLGLPGASTARFLDASLLHDIPIIYILEEPDQAAKNQKDGQGFYKSVREQLRQNGYTGEIRSIRFKQATGSKDPGELHRGIYLLCLIEDEVVHRDKVKAQFREVMQRALDTAIPEGNEILETPESEEYPTPPPPLPATETDVGRWLSNLNAVPSSILSLSHKMTIQTLFLHTGLFTEKGADEWHRIDADQLCKLCCMSKERFLENISYLTVTLGLFQKYHEKSWYGPNGKKKDKFGTDLYIRWMPGVWGTYPSTWYVRDGIQERKQAGGIQQLSEKKLQEEPVQCFYCQSTNVDRSEVQYCNDCHEYHHERIQFAPIPFKPRADDATIGHNAPLMKDTVINGALCPPDEMFSSEPVETQSDDILVEEDTSNIVSTGHNAPLITVSLINGALCPPDDPIIMDGKPCSSCQCTVKWVSPKSGHPFCGKCHTPIGLDAEQKERLKKAVRASLPLIAEPTSMRHAWQ